MFGSINYKKYPILFVDDDLDALKSIKMILEANFTVDSTDDPYKALEMLKEREYALVLSDQKMPRMPGFELLARVKEISPLTIRVLITGFAEIEDAIKAINNGEIYRYIPKKIPNEDRDILIRQAIQWYHLQKERDRLYTANQRLLKQLATQEKISAVGYFGNVVYGMFRPLLQHLGHDLAREEMKYVCGDACVRPKETKMLMEKIAKAIVTLKEITDSEFFVKPLKEGIPVSEENANLNGIIRNILDYYVPRYTVSKEEEKKYRFDLKLAKDLPQLRLDVDKIDYAIERIILNSMESREDVTVTIKTKLKTEEKKEYVVLEISDDGCSIPKDNLEKVRTPFFTTKPGQAGLGLTIAENIFNKHEATIDIKNNLLKGITVTITFLPQH
ncbi:MAG: response regulator [bacterium]